jgi:hypothetical protein
MLKPAVGRLPMNVPMTIWRAKSPDVCDRACWFQVSPTPLRPHHHLLRIVDVALIPLSNVMARRSGGGCCAAGACSSAPARSTARSSGRKSRQFDEDLHSRATTGSIRGANALFGT